MLALYLLNLKIKKSPANIAFTEDCFLSLVPRAGVEPARVAPLVFETSASTDSAIWAPKSAGKGTKKN